MFGNKRKSEIKQDANQIEISQTMRVGNVVKNRDALEVNLHQFGGDLPRVSYVSLDLDLDELVEMKELCEIEEEFEVKLVITSLQDKE